MTLLLPRFALALSFLAPLAAPALTPPSAIAPATAQPPTTPPGNTTIPAVSANTLAGEPVHLPADLRGKDGILVLGFGKDARAEVRDWGKRLAGDYFASPTVLYYEMPVIAGVPRLLRGFVLKQIAGEVSERGKHHFVPISDNEARWRDLAHVTDVNHAYLLVVDASGSVQWTTSGPLTNAAYQAVRDHLPASQK